MSKKILITLALTNLLWNFILAVYFKGYDAGNIDAGPFLIADFSGHHYLFRSYVYIAFWHLVYIVGLFVKNRIVANLIGLASLGLAFFTYSSVYLQKLVYLDRSTFMYSLPESRSIDIIGLVLLTSLLCIHVARMFRVRGQMS